MYFPIVILPRVQRVYCSRKKNEDELKLCNVNFIKHGFASIKETSKSIGFIEVEQMCVIAALQLEFSIDVVDAKVRKF